LLRAGGNRLVHLGESSARRLVDEDSSYRDDDYN
jgi:hypothetical protein